MASKEAPNRAPVVVREGFTVKIEDISLAEDSGWRPVDAERVEELVQTFLGGQYGLGLLKAPSIIQQDGKPKMASDGRQRLSDGKNTMTALTRVKSIYSSEEQRAQHEWTQSLVTALTEGVRVTVLEYPEDDMDLVLAYNVLVHDVETNKYKATNLRDMADVAERFRKRTPGGDWSKTLDALVKVYGKGKKTFCWRMVLVCQTIAPAVLEKAVSAKIPNTYVVHNPYFTGHGAAQEKRLTSAGMISVLQWYADDAALGKGMSAKVFEDEYCSVAKHCERWMKLLKKEFGQLSERPAAKRVREFLLGGRPRLQVLGCMKAGIRLDGVSDERPGVPQCRALWGELETLKRGAGAPQPDASADGAAIGGQAAAASGDGGADVDMGGSASLVAYDVEERDPAEEAASALVEASFDKVHHFDNLEDLKRDILGILGPTSKINILVDAVTSKPKVPLAMLENVASLIKDIPTTRVRVIMPAAGRLEVLVAGMNKMQTLFPEGAHFSVQLVRGARQNGIGKGARRPAYVQLLVLGSQGPVDCPNQIDISSCRASAGERIHYRCSDAACPLRSAEEKAALAAAFNADDPLAEDDPFKEIPEDDRAGSANEAEQANEEDERDVPVVQGAPKSGERAFYRELWPFAYSRSHYKALFASLGAAEPSAHAVIMTTSSHPSPILASTDMSMQTRVLYKNVTHHACEHGKDLLRAVWKKEYLKKEKAKIDPEKKRLLQDDVRFVKVQAPADQTICFSQVVPSGTTPAWRAGVDLSPDESTLEKGMMELMARQLQDSGLAVSEKDGERFLVPKMHVNEGDEVIVANCLVYSNPSSVRTFLNQGGNAALIDGPLIQIDGVQEPDGSEKSFYCVLLGAARLACDYRGKRKHPNCVIQVRPEQGPNDGLLRLVAKTHNICGIAEGAPIVIDCGQNYVPSEAPQTSPAKRFKGALDMIWTSFRIDQEADSRAASAAGGTVPPAPVDGQPPPGGTPPGPLQASSAGVAPGPVAGVAQPARAHRNREASHVIFEGFRPRADAQARAHRNTEASHVIFRWLVRRFGCQPRLAASPH